MVMMVPVQLIATVLLLAEPHARHHDGGRTLQHRVVVLPLYLATARHTTNTDPAHSRPTEMAPDQVAHYDDDVEQQKHDSHRYQDGERRFTFHDFCRTPVQLLLVRHSERPILAGLLQLLRVLRMLQDTGGQLGRAGTLLRDGGSGGSRRGIVHPRPGQRILHLVQQLPEGVLRRPLDVDVNRVQIQPGLDHRGGDARIGQYFQQIVPMLVRQCLVRVHQAVRERDRIQDVIGFQLGHAVQQIVSTCRPSSRYGRSGGNVDA
uniref:Secreted protein n=1 Tax=Anopheles coluzzii TaxID=1518534 RepID=A0A8W7PBI5_ANOCL